MKYPISFVLPCLIFISTVKAQHHSAETSTVNTNPFMFQGVLSQLLSDPELKDYKLDATVMTIAPGAVDTVSHRHDCDLFGYVLEGEVSIGLEHKAPVTYTAGQMFFEKRNVLHSVAANNIKHATTKVLLIFIIKSGRTGYTPAYSTMHDKK